MGYVYATQILEYDQTKMFRLRTPTMIVACVFVLGATHFFLINAFVFIYMAYSPDHKPT